MKRSGLAAALLAVSSSFCYSETVNGITNNAAQNGQQWTMDPLLPAQTGLTVGGVFYRYSIEKDPTTDSKVHIQNQDAINGGMLYRNTDDWSGVPGNTIINNFSLPDIPAEYFGQGSIEVEGDGTIQEPRIFYSYQYDPCADPLSSPTCPGYTDAMNQYLLDNALLNNEVTVPDPLDNEFVQDTLDQEVDIREEDDLEEESEEEEADMEEALAAADNALIIADTAAQSAMMTALTFTPGFNNYLQTTIPGGVYNETLQFEPKEIPENRNALRVGLAQQLLHQEMVDSQYQLGDEASNE